MLALVHHISRTWSSACRPPYACDAVSDQPTPTPLRTLYRELARSLVNVPSQVPDPPLGTPCPSRYVVTILLNRSSENLKPIFFSKPSPSFNFPLLFNCLPVYVKPRLDSNLCKSRHTSTQMLMLMLPFPDMQPATLDRWAISENLAQAAIEFDERSKQQPGSLETTQFVNLTLCIADSLCVICKQLISAELSSLLKADSKECNKIINHKRRILRKRIKPAQNGFQL
jgi:hypothetical protein